MSDQDGVSEGLCTCISVAYPRIFLVAPIQIIVNMKVVAGVTGGQMTP